MITKGAAQGDLLIVCCGKIPTGATEVQPEDGRLILARGEATGHHHSLRPSPRVALFRDDGNGSGGTLYFTASEPVALEHQEHGSITFAPGAYKVLRQRVARSGVVRRVAD